MMELHSQNGYQQICHESTYDKRHYSDPAEAEYETGTRPNRSYQNSPSVVLLDEIVNSSVNESGYISCCHISSENLYSTPHTRRQREPLVDVTNLYERPRSTLSVSEKPHSVTQSTDGICSELSGSEGEPGTTNETEAAIASILNRDKRVKQLDQYSTNSTITTQIYEQRDSQNEGDVGNMFSTRESTDETILSKSNITIKPESSISVPTENEGGSKIDKSIIYGPINTPPDPNELSVEASSQYVTNQFIPAVRLPSLFTAQNHTTGQENSFLSKPNTAACYPGLLNSACNTSNLEGENQQLGTNPSWVGVQGSVISSKIGGEIFPLKLNDTNMMVTTTSLAASATTQQVSDAIKYWPWSNRLWSDGTGERFLSLQNEGATNLTLWGSPELNQKDVNGRLMPEFLPGFRMSNNPCGNQMNNNSVSPNITFTQPFRSTNDVSAFQTINTHLSQDQPVSFNKTPELTLYNYYQNPSANLSFHTDNILKDAFCGSSNQSQNPKQKTKKRETSKLKNSSDPQLPMVSNSMFPQPSWPSFNDGARVFVNHEQPNTWNNTNEIALAPDRIAGQNSINWQLKRSRNYQTSLHKKSKKHRLSRNRPLNDTALSVMENWYVNHIDNPYPTNAEKVELAMLGQITTTQVSSWFANRRTRSCNTRPKKNRQKLYDQLFQFAAELETHTQGLVRAVEIEERLKKIMDDYLS